MIFQIAYLVIILVVVVILYKIFTTLNHIRIDLLDYNSHQGEIKYWKSKVLGSKDDEYAALLAIFYNDLLHPRKKESSRIKVYEHLKEVYNENFKQLGYDFPEYPFKQKEK